MKWLWAFIIFILMAGSVADISYGAGNERFIFSDLTATDKSTGLVWARDANITNKSMKWNEALRFLKQLNEKKHGGYSDWRLPTKDELQTIIDYAKSQGHARDIYYLFNEIGFKNVQAGWYWSSSTYYSSAYNPTRTSRTWSVSMVDGGEYPMVDGSESSRVEIDTSYVWPVRAGQ